jgi:hypothetical protein
VQVVLAEAGLVGRVGEEVAVVAHLPAAEGEELLALRQHVLVQQDLLGRLEGTFAAAEDRVLLPLLGARVVPVAILEERRCRVRLLDPREHFLVERLLQRLGRFHHRVRVGRFRAQVLLHLGGALVPQPEVVVREGVPVELHRVRHLARDGRL